MRQSGRRAGAGNLRQHDGFWAGTPSRPARSLSGRSLLRQAAAGLALALCLSACVGDGTTQGVMGASAAAPAAGGSGIAAPDIGGRWTLSSSAGGACAMTFVAGAAEDGTIRPEGGCPGKFFTSRKWSFEGGALVIRNHNGEPLVRLTAVSPTRYEGQSAAGQQVSLVR